jgi:hypothetical protein
MAWTIPGFFRGVPVDDATEVRAYRRALVQRAVTVPIDSYFSEAFPDQLSCAALDLSGSSHISSSRIVAKLSSDVKVLLGEFKCCSQRYAGGIVEGLPFVLPS